MLNRKLSMAWEKWQYEAAEIEQQQQQQQLQLQQQYEAACMKAEKEAMLKVLKKLMNSKMFTAWEQWRTWAAEMRRLQKMMGGAVRRMILRKLSQAWEQCQWVVAVLKEQPFMSG